MLYTPRSGTNSIASYFLKQKSEYKYFNQPFTIYREDGTPRTQYSECIKYDNVLIKSDVVNFYKQNINKNKIKEDFDKVLLISRRNKKEQSISFFLASEFKNYLDNTKRSYFVDAINSNFLKTTIEYQEKCEQLLNTYKDKSFPYFYYEDLFYGDFKSLFDFLEIENIESDFENILSVKNRYRQSDVLSKKEITLI